MRKRWAASVMVALLGGAAVGALTFPQKLQEPRPEETAARQEATLERFRHLGRQVTTLRLQVPTLDVVVLVPDTETFLQAISSWSLAGRWPVLIEDARFAPLFIERFAPAKVVRLPSVRTSSSTAPTRADLQAAAAAAWGAKDPQSLRQRWQQLEWQPPGVAIAAIDDPAWPAAVALAADRGQPLVFLEGDYGRPNSAMPPSRWQRLQRDVERAVARSGYAYAGLGNDIDTITLARSLPVKYQAPEGPRAELAVTDGLARHDRDRRWAVAGWIYGSSARSLYQAMCAIFLDARRALFYNSYPPDGTWASYQMETAATRARQLGLSVDRIEHPNASVPAWQALASQPWHYDWVFVNSRGHKASFAAGQGTATVEDLPEPRTPTAVYFIHSWSATTPDDPRTIAGRWLENGAYLYVGSVHEPFLRAFPPPETVTRRLFSQIPFLVATRHLSRAPWKIATIGDPLAVALPPIPRHAPKIP